MISIKDRVVFAVQVRLNSTRLPFKSLLPLPFPNNKELLGDTLSIISTQLNHYSDKLVFLCPKSDLPIFSLIHPSLSFYGGDESDVLKRYSDFCTTIEPSWVIRLCCDSPYMFYPLLDNIHTFLENESPKNIFFTTRIKHNVKGSNVDAFYSTFFPQIVSSVKDPVTEPNDLDFLKLLPRYGKPFPTDLYSSHHSTFSTFCIDTKEDYTQAFN